MQTSRFPLWPRLIIGSVLAAVAPWPSLRADSIVEIVNGQPTVVVENVAAEKAQRELRGGHVVNYYQLGGDKFVQQRMRQSQNELKVVRSPLPERNRMLKEWQEKGWTVEVRAGGSRRATFYNFCTRPAPVASGQVPTSECHDHIVIQTSPTATTTVPFANIDEIDGKDESKLVIKLLDGTKVEGPIATIERRRAPWSQKFYAFPSYGPAEPRIEWIPHTGREIRFVRPQK